jgi:hypothetical protein
VRDNRFAKPRLCPFSSGTSGHAPVQAFQRLHRGYSIHLVYCFREQSASVWRGWRRLAHRSLPHRGPMTNSPLSKPNSAPSNGPSRSQQIRYCAVSVNRAPLTDRSRRTGLCHDRRTDISLAAASGRRLQQVVETTATPSSARDTIIGRGTRDQALSKKI